MYYFAKKLKTDFDKIIPILQEKLKEVGFGVLTEIDMQQKLKEKLNVDIPKYKIFGVCNPPLAYKSLQVDDKVGLLLPCKVVVQEIEDGSIEVSALDPKAAMSIVQAGEALEEVASDATALLKKVIENL